MINHLCRLAILAMLFTACYSNQPEVLTVQFEQPFVCNGATDVALCPYLGFNTMRNFWGQLDVYCDTVNPPQQKIFTLTAVKDMGNTKVPLAARLQPATTYYWRGAMRNSAGEVFSDTYSFTTIALAQIDRPWRLAGFLSWAAYARIHRGIPKDTIPRLDGDIIHMQPQGALANVVRYGGKQAQPALSEPFAFDPDTIQIGTTRRAVINFGYVTRLCTSDTITPYLVLQGDTSTMLLLYCSDIP